VARASPESHERERQCVAEAAAALLDRGLTHGTAGNVSVRVDDGFLITPSGVGRDALCADVIVRMRGGATPEEKAPKPSSEWRFHAAIYAARPDVDAIVHAHSPCATAIACLRRDIPAFHYMIAVAGGTDIRCAPYATFGSAALAEAVVSALEHRRACLLANHGVVAVGGTLGEALDLAGEIEYLARIFCLALGAGKPVLIEEAEMERVLEAFAAYGQGTRDG